jgi:hypothetical protein
VGELAFTQRRCIKLNSPDSNGWRTLASYDDGKPFLLRKRTGSGLIYACTSLPHRDWSNLNEGYVLLPMIQRILQQGSARLSLANNELCGKWKPEKDQLWTCIDSTANKNPLWHAGVYRYNTRLVALNRPPSEDCRKIVESKTLRELLSGCNVEIREEIVKSNEENLQSEIWHVFIYLALACMVVEAGLLLQNKVKTGK